MFAAVVLGLLLVLASALPLAWKWHLGLARASATLLILALSFGLVLGASGIADAIGIVWSAGLVWLSTIAAGLAILAYRFYRDPERRSPEDESLIVSPADGEVLYVREARNGVLPVSTKQGRNHTLEELTRTPLQTGDAFVIGIGMTFLDVHVNRAPISGRISFQRSFPGRFGSLRRPAMVFHNARLTTLIERDDIQIAVVQITSRLVHQIVSFVRQGQDIHTGDRIGMIRFGSQVDLVLPARPLLSIAIRPGDTVRAGETVVASWARAALGVIQ